MTVRETWFSVGFAMATAWWIGWATVWSALVRRQTTREIETRATEVDARARAQLRDFRLP